MLFRAISYAPLERDRSFRNRANAVMAMTHALMINASPMMDTDRVSVLPFPRTIPVNAPASAMSDAGMKNSFPEIRRTATKDFGFVAIDFSVRYVS